MEVETQLQIAQNLGYLQAQQMKELLSACAEVGRILNGLLASICKPERLATGGWQLATVSYANNRNLQIAAG